MLLSDEQHDSLLPAGLTLTRHITVAPNTVRLAIARRDASTGTLGSVMVPAAQLARKR